MKKEATTKLKYSLILFALFLVYTLLVLTVDVKPIGPENSEVGFAGLNSIFSNAFDYNEFCYNVTDLLGKLAFLVCIGFACVGAYQLFTRKSFLKVDRDILILGFFYIVVILSYFIFEFVVINYRPVVLDEGLEASYPSSHTMLAVTVFTSAILQLKDRIKNETLLKIVKIFCIALVAIAVIGRIISGVHWITDIIGSVILSASYILLYQGLILLGKKA